MRRIVEQPISRAIRLLCFALFLLCFGLPVSAQMAEPLVRVPTLKYLDPLGYVYKVGQQFKVNVDYSPLNGTGDLNKLRARLFRGTYDYLTREIEQRAVGDCISYFTTVLQPSEYNGGIHFGLNFDESWLHPNGTSILSEEHYILVFELDGPEGPWLDLDRKSVDRYFRQGFFFTVQPDHSVKPEEARRLVSAMREQTKQAKEALSRRQAAVAAAAVGPIPAPAQESANRGIVRCRKLRLLRDQNSSTLPILDPVACRVDNKSHKRKNWFSRLAGANRQPDETAASLVEGLVGG